MYKRMSAKGLIDSLSDEELQELLQQSFEEYGVEYSLEETGIEWPSIKEIFGSLGNKDEE